LSIPLYHVLDSNHEPRPPETKADRFVEGRSYPKYCEIGRRIPSRKTGHFECSNITWAQEGGLPSQSRHKEGEYSTGVENYLRGKKVWLYITGYEICKGIAAISINILQRERFLGFDTTTTDPDPSTVEEQSAQVSKTTNKMSSISSNI